ncbi:MAG: hypothetical protein IJE10_11295 [Clostridia bacterium]|nr:hypothetical protein [Clostridia bacterium]
MTAKEWLNRAYKIDGRIKVLEAEKRELITAAARCTAGVGEVSVKTSHGNGSERAFVDYAESMKRYEKRIDKLLEKLYQIKSEVVTAISQVENPIYQQLLILRYLQYKKWEDIAIEIHFDFDYVRGRLHGKALKKIGELLKLT